jgi:putative transposase
VIGARLACKALGLSRATLYRCGRPARARVLGPRPPSPRALSSAERAEVLETLHSDRFIDLSPREVHAILLDEGRYIASVRTFYRVLFAAGEGRERRAQRAAVPRSAPRLCARGPRQVWTWDITRLSTDGPGRWLYLYVILDIHSRYVVGWTVASRESAVIARHLIAHAYRTQGLEPGAATLHSDRGAQMTAKPVSQLLADLGLAQSLSRPRVSNDNPFVESHFKTLKYRPDFPDSFAGIDDARLLLAGFFRWYNAEHRHEGIAYLTPQDVHYGRATQRLVARTTVLDRAYIAHPERFVRGPASPASLPEEVWINRPTPAAAVAAAQA